MEERKMIVYEHRKGGGRFMTMYNEDTIYKDDEHHIIVEKDISEKTAKLLCEQRKVNNLFSFLDDMPDEIRNTKADAYIASLLLGDE